MAQNVYQLPKAQPMKTKISKLSKTKQKEQRIKAILSNYKIPFEITDASVDLRGMVDNYSQGIIPNKDIGIITDAVLGPAPMPRLSVDPRLLLNIPKFEFVPMDDIAIKPSFQRHLMPNHVGSIEPKFNPETIIVPCAVKDPFSGKFLLWDGHHTTRVCERQGWTHMPVWYTEADTSNAQTLEDATKILISHAGNSMITINKSGKRGLDRLNEHLIAVDCGHTEPVTVQRIVDANNCQVKRVSSHAGDISHIEHLYGAYDLVQASSGIKGIYLARSLKFHRDTWPKEEVRGIMMLAMARLYQQTEIQTGTLLPTNFDIEFGNILKRVYGQSEKVHIRLKEQFESHVRSLGAHPVVVTSGLVLTYMKHGKNFKISQPESTFPVQ